MRYLRRIFQSLPVLAILLAGSQPALATNSNSSCPRNNGGVFVPRGFCAHVFAKAVGPLRHLTVAADGTVYAALSSPRHGGGIAVLRDTNGDGMADSIEYFGDVSGTGIKIHDGYLYFGENDKIVRFPLPKSGAVPQGEPLVVVSGFPEQHQHASKSLAFGPDGGLYVGIGAPSNACQKRDRVEHSPGMDPCPLLAMHGGIWRFKADTLDQSVTENQNYASGLRNMVAIAWNTQSQALYGVMMGRDQLHDNWPERYTIKQSAELPAEELLRIDQGANYGWPYCYYDGIQQKLVLAPEYGGDGMKVGTCSRYTSPLQAFPAHWAPEAIAFYTGKAFPASYRGGAFIAFHGSWNRAPLPQKGFVVAFVPFKDGKPSGHWRVFATGFAGGGVIHSPADARFRPVGVAVGPDGALYIAESQSGWIWRVTYGTAQTPAKASATATAAATQHGGSAPNW